MKIFTKHFKLNFPKKVLLSTKAYEHKCTFKNHTQLNILELNSSFNIINISYII